MRQALPLRVIEFCGTPGGGKSTIARAFANRHRDRVTLVELDMYKRLPEAWYASRFKLRHPIAFTSLFLFVMRYHMRGLFWFSLHLALRAAAKYEKAGRVPHTAVVDEGLMHALAVLPARPLSEKTMRSYLGRFPLPDAVCLARAGDFHRFHVEGAHVHPRARLGAQRLASWEAAVRENVVLLERCLSEVGVTIMTLPERESAPLEETLMFLERGLLN